MLVLTGVNFAEKDNMYYQTKDSLIKLMGNLTEEKAGTGPDIRLEPAWKKLASSYRKECGQDFKTGWMKMKLNPLGSNGKIILCNSCGSYRHLVAEFQDSWENIVKRKTSQFNMKLMGQRDEDKLKGDKNESVESFKFGEVCSSSVVNKE